MKLSTRSRYGVRMLYELALNYGRETITLKEVARRQEMSEKYLSKLVIPLKAAKLVRSSRGAGGGYSLARSPSTITLLEIVELLEGEITSVDCVEDGGVCNRTSLCPAREVWCRLDRVVSDFLEAITLEEVVNSGKQMSGVLSYSI